MMTLTIGGTGPRVGRLGSVAYWRMVRSDISYPAKAVAIARL
jgi:hypothetical protein